MAGFTVRSRGISEGRGASLSSGQVPNIPRVVNVQDPAYGAKGDGTTDDTAAIQLAINTLHQQGFNNNSGGGVVYLPATLGNYRTTSALITYPHIRLVGEQSFAFDGSRGSRLKADPAGSYTNGTYAGAFMVKQDGAAVGTFWDGGSLEHLTLDCNSAAGLGAAHLWDSGENSQVQFIYITNTGITARTIADAVTNATTTVTSATAAFTADDVNAVVTGTNIPANTKISVVNSATSVTISNAASGSGSGGSLTVNRPADGLVVEGTGSAGVLRSVRGGNLPGALLRIKNFTGGTWLVEGLSGDANTGGVLRVSSAAAGADPASITVLNMKGENGGAWNRQDPVVLLDNCDMVGLNIIGGSFVTGFASTDIVRIDQPVATRGGPSVSLTGLEGTNPFNFGYTNLVRDTSTGQAIPANPNYVHLYPNVLWGRSLIVGGGDGGASIVTPKATPAYGATVTPDAQAGEWQTVTVTNATAFTIAAPANPPSANQNAEMTVEVFNNSGGAMGAITWNAAFVFPTGAWVNPASTKRRFARFEWNGASWVCTSVATADY